MMTALSPHGLVFPPHSSESERQVMLAATSVAPIKSRCFDCSSRSPIERFVGSAPRGTADLRRMATRKNDRPPTGRLT